MKKLTLALLVALAVPLVASAAPTQVIPDQAKKDYMAGGVQVAASACTGNGQPSVCCTAAGTGATCPVFKMALFTSSTTTSTSTTTYAGLTNEVANGNGYTTGGVTLSGYSLTVAGNHACVTFTSPSWAGSTITARAAVFYCSANCPTLDVLGSYCLDGGACAADTVSTAGPFNVTIPAGFLCGN